MPLLDQNFSLPFGAGALPIYDPAAEAEDARAKAAAVLMARMRRRPAQEPAQAPAVDTGMAGGAGVPFSGAGDLSSLAAMVGGGGAPGATPTLPASDPAALTPPVGILNGAQAPESTVAAAASPSQMPQLPDPNVPMQPRSIPATPMPAAPVLDPTAMAAAPPAIRAPANVPETSLMGRVGNGINNNSNLLLALGAGLAGAPSWGTGISRALSGAVQGQALDQKQGQLNQTIRFLQSRGLPPDMAAAAVSNPEILKQILPQIVGARQRKFTQIGESFDGTKQYGFVDEASGKAYDLSGKEIGTDGTAAQANASGLLAKGVTDYDSSLRGDSYLAQFSPDMQAAIKARLRGDVQPTGNPRVKGFETKANEYARTYADQVGIPYSDALYSERRKMRTELGSVSPATIGGQTKAFNQGVGHLASMADKMKALGNWDPVGVPAVANFINTMRQETNSDVKSVSDAANTLGQTVAGEVGKLFSGSAGGGVHERELTRNRFSTVKSPKQLASALEATAETMESGLHALEQRRDAVFGAKGPNNPHNDIEFVSKGTEANIDHIRDVIAQLRGQKTAPSAATPTAPAIPQFKILKVE